MSIVIPKEAYPLTWPTGVKRTQWRETSRFDKCTNGRELDRIYNELKLAGAKLVVVSSNLPLKEDGFPYAVPTQMPGNDPGVAVYWSRNEKRAGKWQLVPYCMPCDRWNRLADNLHAIGLSIAAMRGMERWGAVSVEQAFAGFTALPPGDGEQIIPKQPEVDWRTVLGETFAPWPVELEPEELLGLAKARHRKLIALKHPDRGGSDEAAALLNAALEAAEQELRPS